VTGSEMDLVQELVKAVMGGASTSTAAQGALMWVGLLIVGIVVMAAMSMSQAKRV
jgi:hypothetical protein